ncbi:MAG TPA: thiol-disulfide oxidoreductase DCC family protein [Phycisphaerales bacterium]|nr:thiol-disulfide oxidoreductase DCC family protein [Phycisphaerales bacterium]
MSGNSHPVVLFDGVCNLCTSSVQFIVRRDPEGRFRFAPLQSEAARGLLGETSERPDSIALVEGGRVYWKSTAALRIARRLGGLWRVLYVLIVVPRPVRDWVYNIIARNRYRWFGKQDACMMPTPELRARFL